MENETKRTFNFTLKPTVVANAQDRLLIEKKKNPKISLSSIIEEHLTKWGAKKK